MGTRIQQTVKGGPATEAAWKMVMVLSRVFQWIHVLEAAAKKYMTWKIFSSPTPMYKSQQYLLNYLEEHWQVKDENPTKFHSLPKCTNSTGICSEMKVSLTYKLQRQDWRTHHLDLHCNCKFGILLISMRCERDYNIISRDLTFTICMFAGSSCGIFSPSSWSSRKGYLNHLSFTQTWTKPKFKKLKLV